MVKKTHKKKKSKRMRGKGMGTHGSGARKNKRHSGMRGGKGFSGSGKRADHKKTLITKLYGHGYFGKKGITSIGTKKDKRKRVNVGQIQENIGSFGDKKGDSFEIDLKDYKILGKGDVKDKLIIKAKKASKTAIKKIEKAGGKIELPKEKAKKKVKESTPEKEVQKSK